LQADFLRFYRIVIDPETGDFGGLSGEEFFGFAERLIAYDGVLTARLHNLIEEEKKHDPSAGLLDKPGTQVVELSDPALAGLVEHETV
jgi:hypothetical protein